MKRKQLPNNKKKYYLYIAVVSLLIAAAALGVFRIKQNYSSRQNALNSEKTKYRNLSIFLQTSLHDTKEEAQKALKQLIDAGFEAYVAPENDKFAVQAFFSTPDAVGKDGWMFNNYDHCLDNHRGFLPLVEAEIKLLNDSFSKRRDFIQSLGGRYIIVVAPDKHSVYPEFLPDSLKPLTGYSTRKHFLEIMTNAGIESLDLTPALLAAKGVERPEGTLYLYDRLGSHWSFPGAYVAALATAQKLREYFPDLPAIANPASVWRSQEPLDVSLEPIQGGDRLLVDWSPLGRFIKQTSWNVHFKNENEFEMKFMDEYSKRTATFPCLVFETKDKSLPTGIIFGDSFGAFLAPYLAKYFSKLIFIGQSDNYGMRFDKELIAAERPDIVLNIFVERRLRRIYSLGDEFRNWQLTPPFDSMRKANR